jgi:CRISPR-associated endonuclease Csn1
MQIKNRYTLGLDIGIASVGWCVLGENHIIDLGVRAFDKAETAKEGDSLNLVRRSARLMRRRLRRRAWRLTKLARVLKRHGVITDTLLFQPQHPFQYPLWQLRVDGLDRLLSAEEWSRVIYHLCKHRGFYWTSRAEKKQAEADGKSESGKVKDGLAKTTSFMRENDYRSAAEMVLAKFPEAQRNKQGDYGKALSRELLGEELKNLFQRQCKLGNPHASEMLEKAILGNGDHKTGLFWAQKPALVGNALLRMLGKCTFEPDEYRAPKASFTAERHVWLTRLNNLRIVVGGITRPLNEQERQLVLPLPYNYDSDLTYKRLASTLVKAGQLPDTFRFAGLSYPSEAQKAEGKGKDPEVAALIKIPAWQEIRLKLKKAGLETEWKSMAGAAIAGRPELLDQIAWVLSVYKDEDDVAIELCKLPLPNAVVMVDALQDIRFDKFHALSLKALRKIVPYMETGLRYDEACERSGYEHNQPQKASGSQQKYLPPFYAGRDKLGRMVFAQNIDIPRNPVVLRALNQARKVVNAIVRQYGPPTVVHIEMARDLSKPLDERKQIEKDQTEFRERNERDKVSFSEAFGIVGAPKGGDYEKWRLYREQQGKCAYSVSPIDITRLLEQGYVEVDHALPYSRSFDDSKNNKVLAFTKENRDKGNRTPYEYLGGAEDKPRWRQFVSFVESTKAYRLAKRSRLLRKDFGTEAESEFRERNLNDTRYICRFFKNYVERYLQLADSSDTKRCVVVSGQLTAFLRARWGLTKVRSDNDRHHALDAAVVAACSHGMVKRLSDYARRKELGAIREGHTDLETGEIPNPAMSQQIRQHFPDPWPNFRDELKARLYIDDPALLRTEMERLDSYSREALEELRPLFVSRSVTRRGGGEIHKAKIFSIKEGAPNKAYEKVQLSALTLAKLEKMVGKDDPRNQALYEILQDRLRKFGDDPKKAFGPQQPKLLKPSGEGKDAPEVRAIRVEITQNSGLRVRNGIADLGEMTHVDIFRQKVGYSIKPRYQANPEMIRGAAGDYANVEATEFCFSLTKNDYVEVLIGTETVQGYFVMYESDGRMTLRKHDQPQPDKTYFRKTVAKASHITKFHVDILGNVYVAKLEPSYGLA